LFVKKVWIEQQIPLERVYSAKSIFTILKNLNDNPDRNNAYYLHQGGLLNHIDAFF
jgi:1-aminocyclopropane-1-carboxylate deaminase/D-cysteine desulfhydrase-like pyridoxal-dependent ACC family enzyme